MTFTFTEDISVLFLNRDVLPFLYFESYIASIFKDPPYNDLYWLFDLWFPNSKFILSVRNETYDYVNSLIKMVNKHNVELKDYLIWNQQQNITDAPFNESLFVWNAKYAVSIHEYAMLQARVYDLHLTKVFKYFESRNRTHDLLVFDPHKFEDPYQPLIEFLGCDRPQKGPKGVDVHSSVMISQLVNS